MKLISNQLYDNANYANYAHYPEIKTTNKSVLTLQKQLTKVYPNSKSDSSSSSSSDDES